MDSYSTETLDSSVMTIYCRDSLILILPWFWRFYWKTWRGFAHFAAIFYSPLLTLLRCKQTHDWPTLRWLVGRRSSGSFTSSCCEKFRTCDDGLGLSVHRWRPSRRREECLLRNSTSINAHLTKLRPSRLPLDMLHESITSFSQYLSLLVCTTSLYNHQLPCY